MGDDPRHGGITEGRHECDSDGTTTAVSVNSFPGKSVYELARELRVHYGQTGVTTRGRDSQARR